MENFQYHMYTDIVFGKGAEKQVAKKVKEYGGTKVMLVYGGGSVKRSGLYDIVVAELNDAGIPFIELGGVQPNPRLSLVKKGLEQAKAEYEKPFAYEEELKSKTARQFELNTQLDLENKPITEENGQEISQVAENAYPYGERKDYR